MPLIGSSSTRSHVVQVLLYLACGVTAVLLDLSTYRVLMLIGVWYLYATPISSCIGTISAFFLQKHVVFRRHSQIMKHAIRYGILTAWNLFCQTVIVYVLVTVLLFDPMIAKVLGVGCVVLWNFFLYKFVVYV